MLTLTAPAKINLGLAVLRRRTDGYHDIATIFLKISLADTLILASNPAALTVHCDHPDVGDVQQNLVYRAAIALQPLAAEQGAHITLHKKIPVAAGLGGGSSDAAAALLGLNTMWNLHLSYTDLLPYAARIGADVPFFLLPTPAALGQGRGDELEPVACPVQFPLVLVKPPIAISTAWAYRQLKFELTETSKDTTILKRYLEKGDIEGVGAHCFNDFEHALFPQIPVLHEVKCALQRPGVYGVCMSGSGPTVYAICASDIIAQDVADAVQHKGWEVWVCQAGAVPSVCHK